MKTDQFTLILKSLSKATGRMAWDSPEGYELRTHPDLCEIADRISQEIPHGISKFLYGFRVIEVSGSVALIGIGMEELHINPNKIKLPWLVKELTPSDIFDGWIKVNPWLKNWLNP